MKTRILALAVTVSAVFLASCSLIESIVPGARTARETKEKIDKCNALEKMKIAIEEETGLGGAVALNWVKMGGGLYIALPTDRPADLASREPKDQRQWWEQQASYPSAATNELVHYVNVVGKNLAAQSTRPTLDWSFGVIDSDGFNAYSAPGGYVLVTRGLLMQVTSEAQLAGVLGHEIGHVTKQHALHQYAKIKANTCNIAVGGGVAGDALRATGVTGAFESLISNNSGGLLNLSDVSNIGPLKELTKRVVKTLAESGFGNEDEFESDQVAVGLLVSAGYNPYEYRDFLGKLPPATHHPATKDRQDRIVAFLKAQTPAADQFGPSDDFSQYKKVALKDELKAAQKSGSATANKPNP